MPAHGTSIWIIIEADRSAATICLTWNADATGYRLQTSESLSAWTYYGDLLTGPGTLDDPITDDRARRYYRLAKP